MSASSLKGFRIYIPSLRQYLRIFALQMFDTQIYAKLNHYCAYRERCVSEVITKLKALKIEKEDFDGYVSRLKEDNFLNEERFVKSFVSSYSKKKWGKLKIKNALSSKRIDSALIKKHLDDLNTEDYTEQIKNVAEKKLKTIKADTKTEVKTKLMRFLLSKGYESDKVMKVIKELKF